MKNFDVISAKKWKSRSNNNKEYDHEVLLDFPV